MSGLSSGGVIIIVVVVIVVVIIVVISVLCCICGKCEQCCRDSREKAYEREDVQRQTEMAERQRQFDEIRVEREAARNQIRAKYNLGGGKTNEAVVP